MEDDDDTLIACLNVTCAAWDRKVVIELLVALYQHYSASRTRCFSVQSFPTITFLLI